MALPQGDGQLRQARSQAMRVFSLGKDALTLVITNVD